MYTQKFDHFYTIAEYFQIVCLPTGVALHIEVDVFSASVYGRPM